MPQRGDAADTPLHHGTVTVFRASQISSSSPLSPSEQLSAVVSSHSNAAGTSHSQHNVSQASTSVHFICICKSIKSYQTFPRLVSQLFLGRGWFTSAGVPRPYIFASRSSSRVIAFFYFFFLLFCSPLLFYITNITILPFYHSIFYTYLLFTLFPIHSLSLWLLCCT